MLKYYEKRSFVLWTEILRHKLQLYIKVSQNFSVQKSIFLIPFLQITGYFSYKLAQCVSSSWKTYVFAFKIVAIFKIIKHCFWQNNNVKRPNLRFCGVLSHPGYSLDTLYKIYELENRELVQGKSIHILKKKLTIIITKVNSYSHETFLAVTPCSAGWNKTALTREGVCVVCCEPKVLRGFPLSGKFWYPCLGLTMSLSWYTSDTACSR